MASAVVPIARLVEDFNIYPRHAVDTSHVADIARALDSGVTVPMPIVEDGTLRIVDGWHRIRAWRKSAGRGAEIEVELRSYPDDTELLKDSIRLNAPNGRKFDQQDRTRSALLLEERGVPREEIATVLSTTRNRVDELLIRVVIVKPKGRGQRPERYPAKPIAYPAAGGSPRVYTREQLGTMNASVGYSLQKIGQLIKEVEMGLFDLTDDRLVARLWALHDAIEQHVPTLTKT